MQRLCPTRSFLVQVLPGNNLYAIPITPSPCQQKQTHIRKTSSPPVPGKTALEYGKDFSLQRKTIRDSSGYEIVFVTPAYLMGVSELFT